MTSFRKMEDRQLCICGHLRTFADDSGLSPVHERALVESLSSFGPVIAIGRPGESLQTLGAARVYVGDDWQEQIRQWIEIIAVVVMRIGESEGLRWEIETVARTCKPTKVVLQVPGSLSQTGAIILDRLISRITHRECHHDYNDVNYIYFDASLAARFIKESLTTAEPWSSDPRNLQLREFDKQMLSDKFDSYCEEKRRLALADRRSRQFWLKIQLSCLALVGIVIVLIILNFDRLF